MDRKHFKCLLWKGLWGLGVIALVLAFFAIQSGKVWGYDSLHWYAGALILAVLAIPIKLDCRSCTVCKIG